MNQSKALADFQLDCQKYYICYALATKGLSDYAEKLLKELNPDRAKSLILGTGHPDDGKWHGSIEFGELFDSSRKNDVFADAIAKSFICAIYSSWDERFRHAVAEEVSSKQKNVNSDLMGDLRHVRNCIVHKKSIITDELSKIKELSWSLSVGYLVVTDEMFRDLIDQINQMLVKVEFD